MRLKPQFARVRRSAQAILLRMSYSSRHAALSVPSKVKRRVLAVAASAGVVASLIVNPAVAATQPASPLQQFSSSTSSTGLDAFLSQVNAQYASLSSSSDVAVRDAAWNLRTSLRQQADALGALNPELPAQAKAAIDQTVETFFPGLIAERTPAPAPAPTPAPAPAPAPEAAPAPAPAPAFDYGSCPKDAKACIDLDGRRSWLQRNGEVYYGSVFIGPGRPGHETPRGTFYVNRKVIDEISWEFNDAPMPYAVYFTNNGIAFHQGDPNILSHGCIRMNRADAQKYFNDLQIGDKVYVY